MSEAKIGFRHSEEACLKMSVAKSGENNHFFGKTHSNATKDKISQANGTMIYVYNLEFQLLYTFSSSRAATSHFNSNKRTIMKYARSNTIFRKEFILSLKVLPSSDISSSNN
jgi:group I intron endonuclease